MKSRNIYWRKTKRHNWNCIAQCADSKAEFVRQIYLAQVDAPDRQIGWTLEETFGLYPDDKKPNYPMKIAPNVTDEATVKALNSFIQYGMVAITPPIMGKFVELELLEKD